MTTNTLPEIIYVRTSAELDNHSAKRFDTGTIYKAILELEEEDTGRNPYRLQVATDGIYIRPEECAWIGGAAWEIVTEEEFNLQNSKQEE